MFMYAAGYSLSKRTNVPFFIDITSGFSRDVCNRQCELGRALITASIAPQVILTSPNIVGIVLRAAARRAAKRITRIARTYVVEPQSGGVDLLMRLRVAGRVILEGYWQDEAYFLLYQADLRAEFTPKDSVHLPTRELSVAVKACEAVCIHVRSYGEVYDLWRGLTNKELRLSAEYFREAVAQVRLRVPAARFFVFSDDIEWARSIFHGPEFRIIQQRECSSPWDVLWTMSLCRHHILSNSTFSWWGRWLKPSDDGLTIAPNDARWKTIFHTPPLPPRWRAFVL